MECSEIWKFNKRSGTHAIQGIDVDEDSPLFSVSFGVET
jgi:hypothetical protein